jgi:hypothetical protein
MSRDMDVSPGWPGVGATPIVPILGRPYPGIRPGLSNQSPDPYSMCIPYVYKDFFLLSECLAGGPVNPGSDHTNERCPGADDGAPGRKARGTIRPGVPRRIPGRWRLTLGWALKSKGSEACARGFRQRCRGRASMALAIGRRHATSADGKRGNRAVLRTGELKS